MVQERVATTQAEIKDIEEQISKVKQKVEITEAQVVAEPSQ